MLIIDWGFKDVVTAQVQPGRTGRQALQGSPPAVLFPDKYTILDIVGGEGLDLQGKQKQHSCTTDG